MMQHLSDTLLAAMGPLLIVFVGLLFLRSCEQSHEVAMARLAYAHGAIEYPPRERAHRTSPVISKPTAAPAPFLEEPQ